MRAIICDKCGEMWKDNNECNINIRTIYISQGSSYSDHLGDYDLCEECETGLWKYINTKLSKDETNSNTSKV